MKCSAFIKIFFKKRIKRKKKENHSLKQIYKLTIRALEKMIKEKMKNSEVKLKEETTLKDFRLKTC